MAQSCSGMKKRDLDLCRRRTVKTVYFCTFPMSQLDSVPLYQVNCSPTTNTLTGGITNTRLSMHPFAIIWPPPCTVREYNNLRDHAYMHRTLRTNATATTSEGMLPTTTLCLRLNSTDPALRSLLEQLCFPHDMHPLQTCHGNSSRTTCMTKTIRIDPLRKGIREMHMQDTNNTIT